MDLMNKIKKMKTKLRYKNKDIPFFISTKFPYYLTEMPRNIDGETMFLIDHHTDVGWGNDRLCFTGMNSFILTEKELNENFELWDDEDEE